jgi:hypothetical protein
MIIVGQVVYIHTYNTVASVFFFFEDSCRVLAFFWRANIWAYFGPIWDYILAFLRGVWALKSQSPAPLFLTNIIPYEGLPIISGGFFFKLVLQISEMCYIAFFLMVLTT